MKGFQGFLGSIKVVWDFLFRVFQVVMVYLVGSGFLGFRAFKV